MKSFLDELRHRGVVRSISYYLGISWVVIGAGDIVFPMMGISESLLKTIVIVVAAGFPLVGLAAWFFSFDDVPSGESGQEKTSMDLLVVIIIGAVFTVSAVYVYVDEETILVPPPVVESKPPREGTYVAVLDIRNRSKHEDGEWLAGGISEELRRQMNTWSEITVLPGVLTRGRDTADLSHDVDFIVDGYLIDEGDGMTVKVDVVNLGAGMEATPISVSALWTEPKQLQVSLASNIAIIFEAAITEDGISVPHKNAWAEYLRYASVSNFGDIEESIYWLEKVLEKDPTWTIGWGLVALYRLQQHNHVADPNYRNLAAAALGNATKDPNQGLWFWVWGIVQSYGYNQLEQGLPVFAAYAGESFFAAQFYPQLAMSVGLNEEAQEPIRRLTQTQPYFSNLFQIMAMNEAVIGDHAEARRAAERMVQLSAKNSYQSHQIAVIQAASAGDFDLADEYLRAMDAIHQSKQEGSFSALSTEALRDNAAAATAVARKDTAAVQKIIERRIERNDYTRAFIYYLMIGKDAEAEAIFDEVKKEEKLTWGWWVYRAAMPPTVRNHPLIRELEQHLGITPALRLAVCLDMAERPAHLGYQCDAEKYALNDATKNSPG